MMKSYMSYLLQNNGTPENAIWFINFNLRRNYVRKEFVETLVSKLRERYKENYVIFNIVNGCNGFIVPQIVIGDS